MSSLIDTTVPLDKAWNTWSDRPAELVFLPLGFSLTPVLYSTSIRKATAIPPGEAIRFGSHALDGSLVEFETTHGGTTIAFTYRKADPFCISGSWQGLRLAEWGLRYWLTLCLRAAAGASVRYAENENAAIMKIGYRFVAVVTEDRPVLVTGHDSVGAVVEDFDGNGYFYLGSRELSGNTIALRFNLEMMRSGRFAAAVADSESLALLRARETLAQRLPPKPPLQNGRHAGALDAVRDVMAWNTLYDRINHRPYTAVSRIWNLGKFAIWYNDQTYAALMTGLLDGYVGLMNMQAAMASGTPQGNFACIVTSNDAWVDRTQAPNGAFIVWMMFLRSRNRFLLELTFGPLARNNRWWRTHRDPDGLGLVSCGTSDVGEALYKGTHFGARNETGMDNSPTHDEAVYEPESRTLSLLDVGLNSSLTLDAEMLSLMAQELGLDADAAEFAGLAERGRRQVSEHLWDSSRQIFANRQREGGFVRSLGPTSFFPMICGAASASQAAALLQHLNDDATFGGDYVIPNVSREDPSFGDNVYWRGRIWPNVNFFVWHALRRYGFDEDASKLASKSMRLFDQSWSERRMAGENYNAVNGEILDQPDTDPFLSWGAMLPALGVAEIMDCNPWNGWEISTDRGDMSFGPIESPIGSVRLVCEDGVLTLFKGNTAWLRTNIVGRLSHLSFGAGSFSCSIAYQPAGEASFIALPRAHAASVGFVRANGEAIKAASGSDGCFSMDLPTAGSDRVDLEVFFTPTGR